MSDLFNLITGAMGLNSYENRTIACIERSDTQIGVSTVLTTDMGYETALGDVNGIHPVERYPNEEKAIEGHKKWCIFSKSAHGIPITKLGYGELIDSEEIVLKIK